jgi:hypothetical protein
MARVVLTLSRVVLPSLHNQKAIRAGAETGNCSDQQD